MKLRTRVHAGVDALALVSIAGPVTYSSHHDFLNVRKQGESDESSLLAPMIDAAHQARSVCWQWRRSSATNASFHYTTPLCSTYPTLLLDRDEKASLYAEFLRDPTGMQVPDENAAQRDNHGEAGAGDASGVRAAAAAVSSAAMAVAAAGAGANDSAEATAQAHDQAHDPLREEVGRPCVPCCLFLVL